MASISKALAPGGGGTFTGDVPGSKGSVFQSTIRPNVVVESFLKDRTPGPLEVPEQEAEIRWGKPSVFSWSVTNPEGGFTPRNVVIGSNDNDDDDEEPFESVTLEFIETARVVEVVRVTNPQDAEQWVDVERIQDITFSVPVDLANSIDQLRDGAIAELFFKYVLNFEEPGA